MGKTIPKKGNCVSKYWSHNFPLIKLAIKKIANL
jgi:hypothetical protein